MLPALCAQRTTADAVATLERAGIPAGPVYTPQQALDDPQVAAMGFLAAVTGYPGLSRPAPVATLPVKLSATPGAIRTPPPRAGEHSDEILTSLGYTPDEIAAFHASGVT